MKNDIWFMYLLCIYKKLIILSLFNVDTLNFTMYILMNLTFPLKTYIIRIHNLISMNIFLAIKDNSFSLQLQRESRKQIIKNLGAVHMKIVLLLFSRLTGKKKIISSRSYTKYFPAWARSQYSKWVT